MNLRKQAFVSILLLIIVLLIFKMTAFDVWLQNYFYDTSATHKLPLERWLISKNNETLEFWFHKIIKIAVAVLGFVILLIGVSGFLIKKISPYREQFLFVAFCIIIVPFTVAGAKHFTDAYCPNQVTLYGGNQPYVHLLEQ